MEDNLKILMLEDNPADAEIVTRFLKKENPNWEFRIAMERDAFLSELDGFAPDIILSDNSMPQFSAVEALEIKNQLKLPIPFIMVTGTATDEFAAGMIKMGADDYILKDRLSRLPSSIKTALKQKKAEKEKLEAELRGEELRTNLNTIFENTSEGFILMDSKGIVRVLNKRAARYGLRIGTREIQVGDPFFDLIREDQESHFRESSYKVLQGEKVQYERKYKDENGEDSWIEFSINPVLEEGKITGICITGRDVTQRKKSEMEREFDRNNLAALINNTQDMMWSVDRDYNLITFNNAFDEVVKDLSGAYVRKGNNILFTTLEKEVPGGFRKYYERAFRGKSFTEIYHYDGKWSERSFYPIYNKRRIIGSAIFSRDITQRKLADAALEETLKELSDYKVALDESSIVSIANPKGIITYVNRNLCKISKYAPEELIGKNHRILNSSFHEKSFIKNLWDTILSGKIWRNEVRNKAKDGSLFWLDSTIVPFLNKKKEPVQFVAINKDITEKKIIERELVIQKIQEQKTITRAMIIAQEMERNRLGVELHDNINQILAGTKLYLGMVGKGNPAFSELIKYPMELIDNSISEIRLLCHRLVTPIKNIDLEQLVKNLLDNLQRSSAIQIELIYSLQTQQLGDDLKLNIFRIIQEQVNNITKYAQANKVMLSIVEKDQFLEVAITDDGVGFQVESKREGIGLSNMTDRIESYNGKIEIISSPGNGCSIGIQIPL